MRLIFAAFTLLMSCAYALALEAPGKVPAHPIAVPAALPPQYLVLPELSCMDQPQQVVDDHLFEIYQNTPKLDGGKDGKEKDFTQKDIRAAEHAHMTLEQFVIQGASPEFRRRVYCMMLALEKAANSDPRLKPGFTRMFADVYRQHMATGVRACDSCSYHGSRRELGYGKGIAVDIVGHGTTMQERLDNDEIVWAWIDEHGEKYGLGRPYPYSDPVHIGPMIGGECLAHYGCDPKQIAKHRSRKSKHHAGKKHLRHFHHRRHHRVS